MWHMHCSPFRKMLLSTFLIIMLLFCMMWTYRKGTCFCKYTWEIYLLIFIVMILLNNLTFVILNSFIHQLLVIFCYYLCTGDSEADKVIRTDQPMYIAWGIGPINGVGTTAKHHPGQRTIGKKYACFCFCFCFVLFLFFSHLSFITSFNHLLKAYYFVFLLIWVLKEFLFWMEMLVNCTIYKYIKVGM